LVSAIDGSAKVLDEDEDEDEEEEEEEEEGGGDWSAALLEERELRLVP
jgi:hypothetical protein